MSEKCYIGELEYRGTFTHGNNSSDFVYSVHSFYIILLQRVNTTIDNFYGIANKNYQEHRVFIFLYCNLSCRKTPKSHAIIASVKCSKKKVSGVAGWLKFRDHMVGDPPDADIIYNRFII